MGGRLGSRFTGLGIATLAGLGAWLAFSGVSDDGETLLTPIHREVASATTVSQGDRFYADDDDGDPKTKQSCTIGYIFPGTTVAEVAAHCLVGGDGSVVYSDDWAEIGVVDSTEDARDVGYIRFYPEVVLGGNPLSGDDRVDRAVAEGDEVCAYGATSDTTVCSTVFYTIDDKGEFWFSDGSWGQQGDSGGPVWTNEGFVGTFSGSADYTEPSGVEGTANYGFQSWR